MKPAHKIALIVLMVVLGATVYGLVRTERQTSIAPGNGTAIENTPEQAAVVDQTPLYTAQRLAHIPTSAAESPFAQEPLRLGNKEMTLALAEAVLDATKHPPILTAEAKQ